MNCFIFFKFFESIIKILFYNFPFYNFFTIFHEEVFQYFFNRVENNVRHQIKIKGWKLFIEHNEDMCGRWMQDIISIQLRWSGNNSLIRNSNERASWGFVETSQRHWQRAFSIALTMLMYMLSTKSTNAIDG